MRGGILQLQMDDIHDLLRVLLIFALAVSNVKKRKTVGECARGHIGSHSILFARSSGNSLSNQDKACFLISPL